MRESRPYGSERGAFSNGRPYRDQTDGHRGLTPSGRRRPVEGRLPCGYGLKRQVRVGQPEFKSVRPNRVNSGTAIMPALYMATVANCGLRPLGKQNRDPVTRTDAVGDEQIGKLIGFPRDVVFVDGIDSGIVAHWDVPAEGAEDISVCLAVRSIALTSLVVDRGNFAGTLYQISRAQRTGVERAQRRPPSKRARFYQIDQPATLF